MRTVAHSFTTVRTRSNAPSTPPAANSTASSRSPSAKPDSYPQIPRTRLGWLGTPAADFVRPPRYGPTERQRISPKSLASYDAAKAVDAASSMAAATGRNLFTCDSPRGSIAEMQSRVRGGQGGQGSFGIFTSRPDSLFSRSVKSRSTSATDAWLWVFPDVK